MTKNPTFLGTEDKLYEITFCYVRVCTYLGNWRASFSVGLFFGMMLMSCYSFLIIYFQEVSSTCSLDCLPASSTQEEEVLPILLHPKELPKLAAPAWKEAPAPAAGQGRGRILWKQQQKRRSRRKKEKVKLITEGRREREREREEGGGSGGCGKMSWGAVGRMWPLHWDSDLSQFVKSKLLKICIWKQRCSGALI